MTDSTDDSSGLLATAEPTSALLIGGVLGAITFLLCAFLFGARMAVVIAAVAAISALVRRLPAATVMFVVAAALATVPFTSAWMVASLTFGIALALFARARMRARIAAANAATHDGSKASV